MKFSFENFGFIDHGTLELGDLTVICGPNNVGKTYLSHAVHGLVLEASKFVDFAIADELIDKLYKDGVITIDLSAYSDSLPCYLESISKTFTSKIASFFSVDDDYFANTKVEVLPEGLSYAFSEEINHTIHVGTHNEIVYRKPKDSSELCIAYISKNNDQHQDNIPKYMLLSLIKQILNLCLITPIFRPTCPITSDRTGIILFQKQLDFSISSLSCSAAFSDILHQTRGGLFNYPEPTSYNLNLVRSFETISNKKSFISSNLKYQGILDALSDLMQGTCKIINQKLVYLSHVDKTREAVHVPIYLASSSVKSLALIELYVRSIANIGDMLLIEEPELGLDLTCQAKMAALISMLVNAGIKVLITTHSDTILREINNRIMLSCDIADKESIMHSANISHDEILSSGTVKAYYVNSDHTLQQAPVNKYGVDISEIDAIIRHSNAVSNDIFYSIDE